MAAPVLSIVMPFRGAADIQHALDALTDWNTAWLQRNPRAPLIYDSGVVWKRDVCLAPNVAGACERFVAIPLVIAEGFGDCDDLAPWRAAELRVRFGQPRARAYPIRSPGIGWHILVRRNDGTKEDPSKLLGMKGVA